MIRRTINRMFHREPSAPVSIDQIGIPPTMSGVSYASSRRVSSAVVTQRRAANRRARASRKRNRT